MIMENNRICIGIDPGAKGGFAYICGDDKGAFPWDNGEFIRVMKTLSGAGKPIVACVEKVGAMPGQGVTSMFNFGKSAGFIEGVLSAFGVPYQLVPPQKWKKEFSIGSDKGLAIAACNRLFPSISLMRTARCKVPHDGMAEALLMAVYAQRKL